MHKLGITGGISSGKSTAAKYLKNKYKNIYIFNADRESKKHLKSSHGLQKKIINTFGQSITKNNKIDLGLLANKAFSNQTNHKILNGIIWPEIFVLITNKYEEIKETEKKVFIVDAALIFEANFHSFFDNTLLITATKDLRIKRAVKRRNIPLESIQNRISLQLSDNKKKNLANFTITNNGSKDSFLKRLDKIYNNLII